jgi:spermidine/putrescine transport system substrate-binding protein
MKSLIAALMVLCSLALAQKNELRVFIWSEYMDPEIPKQFEKATGTKVRISLFESNEDMLAKLQAGGSGQFDLIVPSHYMIPALLNLKLIRPLDLSKIPNLKNLDPSFQNPSYDPGSKHSVAYQLSSSGILYRKDKLKTAPDSWAAIFDPKQQAGPFTFIDDSREMLSIALRYQGQTINSRDPQVVRKAGQLLADTRKSGKFISFESGVGGMNRVLSGQASMAIVYSGDGMRAASENKNVVFVLPKEGSTLAVDAMMITSKAANPEAAYKFINYILDAKIGAQLSNWTQFGTPNAAARPMLEPALKNAAIYSSLANLEAIQDLGKDTRIYDEIWTALKSR